MKWGLNFLLLLIFFLSFACHNQEEKPKIKVSDLPWPSNSNLKTRWSGQRLTDGTLPLKLSRDFNEEEKALLDQMAQEWTAAVGNIQLFSSPLAVVPNKDPSNLLDYYDGEFGVYRSTHWFEELGAGALGVTQFFGRRQNAGTPAEYLELLEADIVLNYRDFQFTTQPPTLSAYDLGTVVFHEMGHFLGLPHRLESWSVMYPYLHISQSRRQLSELDRQDISDLYRQSLAVEGYSEKISANSQDDEEIFRIVIPLF